VRRMPTNAHTRRRALVREYDPTAFDRVFETLHPPRERPCQAQQVHVEASQGVAIEA
jgi:hypothetical protein